MRISDWSSDVCSSDLHEAPSRVPFRRPSADRRHGGVVALDEPGAGFGGDRAPAIVEKGGPSVAVEALRGDIDRQIRRKLVAGEKIMDAVAVVNAEMGQLLDRPAPHVAAALERKA